MASQPLLYAEDFAPDDEYDLGAYTLDTESLLDFAHEWDPQTMHVDPAAASAGPHHGLIASGLQTVAIYQRLAVDALWSRTAGIAGRSFRLRFTRPVLPGMTLRGRVRVTSVSMRPERGDGVVVVHGSLRTREGTVLEIVADSLIAQRPSESVAPSALDDQGLRGALTQAFGSYDAFALHDDTLRSYGSRHSRSGR